MNGLYVKELLGVFIMPFLNPFLILSLPFCVHARTHVCVLNKMLLTIEKPFPFHLFKNIKCLDFFLAETHLIYFGTGLKASR